MLDLEADQTFLSEGGKDSRELYNRRITQSNVSKETLFGLAWDVEGFRQLLQMKQQFVEKINYIFADLSLPSAGRGNAPTELASLRKKLLEYLQQLFMKKREAAMHLMLFMISEEQRDMKPYAVLVRTLPFKSITDAKVRELKDELVARMKDAGLTNVGFVTDGEWNSIRTQGSERPVSVIQLLMDARKEAKSIRVTEIKKYLTYDQVTNQPEALHPAVPHADALWLRNFIQHARPGELIPFERAIFVFRRVKFFPFHYDPYKWATREDEEPVGDCLKAIMAQYIYVHKINTFYQQGINFINYGYCPEICPETNEAFHEREDHGHLLKRLTNSFCEGNVVVYESLVKFVECLRDPDTGLTKQALAGDRKQSVNDCERVWSVGVRKFMERKGYTAEAHLLCLILNWHKAVDGRGIDEATRSSYVKDMLDWILTDWLPGYREGGIADLRFLDVSRRIATHNVSRLTRETVVGLIANLTSLELRRAEYVSHDLPPEHPRSGTSDDVECFISVLHEMLGDIFDLKEFYDSYPKIMTEFDKRIDRDIRFYYWTGHKHRFRNFALPNFNQPSASGTERLDRVVISRCADPGVFVARRADLPVRGALTVRTQFHNVPENLSEPPNPN